MSLEQVRQLSVILTLQVVDRLEDVGEIPEEQLTYTSCCFDLAEEDLREEQTLEPLPPLSRGTKSSHQIVIENPSLTEIDKLHDIIRKSLPIIKLS